MVFKAQFVLDPCVKLPPLYGSVFPGTDYRDSTAPQISFSSNSPNFSLTFPQLLISSILNLMLGSKTQLGFNPFLKTTPNHILPTLSKLSLISECFRPRSGEPAGRGVHQWAAPPQPHQVQPHHPRDHHHQQPRQAQDH